MSNTKKPTCQNIKMSCRLSNGKDIPCLGVDTSYVNILRKKKI